MINIPVGSMCLVCHHLDKDCSTIDFDSFHPKGKPDSEGYREIICKNFNKMNQAQQFLKHKIILGTLCLS